MTEGSLIYLYGFLVFAVAFLYSSVGHGGASGYLALMALFAFPVESMRSSALVLNLIVSGIAFIHFAHAGHFRWKLFIPFGVISVPAAFAGAFISIDPAIYNRILGVLLILAVFRFSGAFGDRDGELRQINLPIALVAGLAIGVLSGMMGIGGGILLSPLILLLGWADVRQTAAASSLFIFVNSLAGLGGIITNGIEVKSVLLTWVSIAVAGGMLGAYTGSRKLNAKAMRGVLGVLLLAAGLKLIGFTKY